MHIRIENLRHVYTSNGLEPRRILDIEEWNFAPGAQVLLRGISGSGKTTLLNILAGLLAPTSGTVWFDQQSLYALREDQRDDLRAFWVGYVFQMHFLVPTLSALENLEMPLIFSGKARGYQQRKLAQEMLNKVGLLPLRHHRPAQLSTGQRQRIAVARALIHQPQLILADEPTAALDQEASLLVMDLLQRSCQELGATLIVASHDPALNPRFSQIIDLQSGALTPAPMP